MALQQFKARQPVWIKKDSFFNKDIWEATYYYGSIGETHLVKVWNGILEVSEDRILHRPTLLWSLRQLFSKK